VEGGGPRPLGGGGAVAGVGLYKVSRCVVGRRAAAAELPGSSLWRTQTGAPPTCALRSADLRSHTRPCSANGIQRQRRVESRNGDSPNSGTVVGRLRSSKRRRPVGSGAAAAGALRGVGGPSAPGRRWPVGSGAAASGRLLGGGGWWAPSGGGLWALGRGRGRPGGEVQDTRGRENRGRGDDAVVWDGFSRRSFLYRRLWL
jgi:hypothetical protein